MDVARPQRVDPQQVAGTAAAIARSRALLALGACQRGTVAACRPLADARAQMPCPPRSQREVAVAEPVDLGKAIATAIFRLVPDLLDEHGLIFEIADPEPVLRGVASAYAAIAEALPGGRDEAWALLGLLALELDEGDRRADAARR